MSNRAWVTLATNDSYGLGALVLAHSLRRAGSAYPSVVLITPSVTEAMRERLRAVFAEVVTVDVLDSRDAAHLALLQRPELGITFTKIHCWNLTQYEKCVFLDADILVVQNCDELFEREELSAAPDVGWPDCFNSGVFVFTPSTETFNQLIAFARERGSFDGGDQGLLNSFFSDWARGDINKHLPFLYNVTSAAFYSYLPALKHYGQNLKVIHFIGAAKPWLQHFNWDSSTVDAPEHLREFLQLWWDLFVAQVHSQLDTSMVEVEEVPPVPPPEQPPHDVSPHYHYQPVLDPESEFPWHHPGAQIPEENLEERIDFTDINDPWEIYRGHIPPRSENASTCHSVFERNEDQEEIRLYAWAYQSQNNNNKSNEHNVGHYEQLAHSASYNDNYQHNNDNERNYQEYIETQRYNQNHDSQILQDRYEPQTHHYSHEPQSYQQHYEDHRHPPHSEGSQHFQHEYEHQSNQEYCLYEQSIDDNPLHRQHYETQHNPKDLNVQNFQKDFEYIPSNIDSFQNDYNTTYDSIYIEHNNIHQHHDTHEHSCHPHYNVENYPEKQYEYFDHSKQHYTHNYDQLSHQKQSFCVTEKIQNNEHCDTISENQSVSHSKSKNIEVFNLQVQQKKKRTHADRIHRIDFGMSPPKMNGDISDTDSDASEEIIPRHPYDGFYLRHRAIIDSYGRKICTHEIPPVPPQSLSPPPQQVLELVNPEGDQNLSSSGSENQSGVAGNLARVVPGSVSQGEALDELTRRQGWEAGNIDYMGADSFANIWAKISQTLSQPRTSPAKSPPRESTPSKSAPMEDKPAEVILETTTEPVEIAKEATEATTLAEVPAQTEVVAPLETPAVSATAVEAAAKIEGTVPVDAATPEKAAVPVQAVASVETAASVEPAAPVEIATLVGTIATAETVAPVENAAPVETSMPDVAPVKVDAPIEVATLVEVVAQIEAPKPTKSKSTEKVTPDIPLTVEAAAPSVREIVETSAEITTPPEVPVTVEASEKIQVIPTTEAPVQIPVEALQKTECIVPVASAPVAAKAPQAPSDIPVPVETAAEIPVPVETAPEAKKTESAETPAVQSEAVIVSELVAKALKPSDAVEACPASPAVAAEAPKPPLEATPPKVQAAPASDSPPLAHTPSKEEAPAVPAAKSEERRKPAGKLQLSPPAAPDPLPTPDSEAEDAAALAHSIIASELQAAATPTPPTPVDRLTVEEPEVPTPPVGAVSLAQIGVKPVKGKPTIAAQIESSVTEKDDSAATPPAPAQAATAETPKEAAKVAPKDAPKEAPKKKVVKKVVKKESGASGAGGDAPVPPPRKKEKKPKEK